MYILEDIVYSSSINQRMMQWMVPTRKRKAGKERGISTHKTRRPRELSQRTTWLVNNIVHSMISPFASSRAAVTWRRGYDSNSMAGSSFRISQLAIPFVSILISFLAYSSQYFFLYFEPAPLRNTELWRLNIAALCIWICYYRTCTVDPGHIPKDWKPLDSKQLESDRASGRSRWCRKCEASKPPRAHHCRTCQRLADATSMC